MLICFINYNFTFQGTKNFGVICSLLLKCSLRALWPPGSVVGAGHTEGKLRCSSMAQGVVSLTGELELIAGAIVLFTERCVFSRLQPESCEKYWRVWQKKRWQDQGGLYQNHVQVESWHSVNFQRSASFQAVLVYPEICWLRDMLGKWEQADTSSPPTGFAKCKAGKGGLLWKA